jgi:hypothetical protein
VQGRRERRKISPGVTKENAMPGLKNAAGIFSPFSSVLPFSWFLLLGMQKKEQKRRFESRKAFS